MKAPTIRPTLAQTPPLLRLHRRLSVWREQRRHRQPIPESLWKRAAALARIHGVSPVAAALRLNYYDLQRRTGGTAGPRQASAKATFVEIPVAAVTSPLAAPATIEWAHPSGSRLTLRLQHSQDLLAVVQTLARP